MKKYKNTWGLYMWSLTFDDRNLVHPDDIEKFIKLFPTQKIFRCIDEDKDFITIKYENIEFPDTYRVNPQKYELKEEPEFKIEEQVRVKDKPETSGFIREIAWHFNQNTYMFYISVNNKNKSRRYWKDELEKI